MDRTVITSPSAGSSITSWNSRVPHRVPIQPRAITEPSGAARTDTLAPALPATERSLLVIGMALDDGCRSTSAGAPAAPGLSRTGQSL